jgi:hypothetical protein
MSFDIPREPLWDVFTPEIVDALRRIPNPSGALKLRVRVLDAGGLNPSDLNRTLRAYKSAWEVYLHAAFACGLFEGNHGIELRARLTGGDDDNFRSAMSECLVAWFLAGRLKLKLTARPEGRSGRPLELMIKLPNGDISVEVKAPHRPVTDTFWWGDDSDLLESALNKANKQFAKGVRNLLVLVPSLRLPIGDRWRVPLERAFVGETVIHIPLDPEAGGPAGPTTFPFKQSGKLTRVWPRDDPGGFKFEPRFTRIGAVISLSEYIDGEEVKHRALMVRNPNAMVPLPRDQWRGIPEFANQSGQWRWSDAELLETREEEGPTIWDVLDKNSKWLSDAETSDREIRKFLNRGA